MSNYLILPRNSPRHREIPSWGFEGTQAEAVFITNIQTGEFAALKSDELCNFLPTTPPRNVVFVLNTTLAQEADILIVRNVLSLAGEVSRVARSCGLWRLWIHTGDRNAKPNAGDWEEIFKSPDWRPYASLRPCGDMEWYSVFASSEGDHHKLIAAAAGRVRDALSRGAPVGDVIALLDRAWEMTRRQAHLQASYDEVAAMFPLFLEQSAGMKGQNIEDVIGRMHELKIDNAHQPSGLVDLLEQFRAGTVDSQTFCRKFEEVARAVTDQFRGLGKLQAPTNGHTEE